MKSIFSKHGSQLGARPPVAVELSPQGVLAAASPEPDQPHVYAFEPLPAGALVHISNATPTSPNHTATAITTRMATTPS